MTKIVYNASYGGFGLSDAAIEAYLARKDIPYVREENNSPFSQLVGTKYRYKVGATAKDLFYHGDVDRHDPDLVAVVEELGEKASGGLAKLKIAEIYGSLYRVDEYDGYETVREPHEIDWIDATNLNGVEQ